MFCSCFVVVTYTSGEITENSFNYNTKLIVEIMFTTSSSFVCINIKKGDDFR